MDSNCKAKLNLDHVYCHPNDGTYIRSSGGPTEISILKENKQLKAMLLLHLDLIQEQSDQLTAKDKLLASLREENESLKLRLERVDKRLKSRASEPKEHVPPGDSAPNVKKEGPPKVKVLAGEASAATRPAPSATETSHASASFATDKSFPRSESKYKICDDSHHAEHKVTGGEHNGKYITKIVLQRVQSPESKSSLPAEERHPEKEVKTAQPSPGPSYASADRKHFEKDERFGPSYSESIDDTFSCASGSEFGSFSGHSRRRGIIRCGNLTTKKLYNTREWLTDQVDEDLDEEESEAMQVENPNLEIPKWTVKEFHGLYAIEGTEDLSDEVFLKRHNKLEIEEKRRKRWDVQRIREQRNVERLKRRQCKEGRQSDAEGTPTPSSFYPSADSIKFIQITEDIPVTAFGELIPRLKPEPFTLPWPEPSTPGTSSAGAFDWPSTSAAAAASTSTSSSISSASATETGDGGMSQRLSFPCFGPETCFKILRKRRRQTSQTASCSRRSNRKSCD